MKHIHVQNHQDQPDKLSLYVIFAFCDSDLIQR